MKMKINKKVVMIIIAVVIVSGLLIGIGLTPLEVADKDDVDVVTWLDSFRIWLGCCWGCDSSVTQYGYSNGEVMDEYFITSWKDPGVGGSQSAGYSEPITIAAGWKPCYRSDGGNYPTFSSYYWYITVDDDEGQRCVVNKEGLEQGWYDIDYIHIDSGSFVYATFPGTTEGHLQEQDFPGDGRACTTIILTQPVTFRVIGPAKGALRVELRVQDMAWYDCQKWDAKHDFTVVADETYLRSGVGYVSVMPNPFPPGQYFFEEGQTIQFKFVTNWAGHEEDPEGWYVQLFRPDNTICTTATMHSPTDGRDYSTASGGFYIGNNLPDYRIDWIIPDGSYQEGSTNRWYIQLQNTLTTEYEKSFLTLFEGAHEYTPGPTTLTIKNQPANNKWLIGQKPELHMEANENLNAPEDLDEIKEFEYRAYYGGDESQMLIDGTILATRKPGTTTTFQADVTLPSIDRNTDDLWIEALAWSNPGMLLGGLPGNYDSTVLDITQDIDGKGTIMVTVTGDGASLVGAKVQVNGKWEQLTDENGFCSYPELTDGIYTVAASHLDYFGTAVSTVTIKGGNTAYVTLNLSSMMFFMAIAVAIMIIMVFIVIAYFLPVLTIFKVCVMILGIVIAMLVFLFMSGVFRIII